MTVSAHLPKVRLGQTYVAESGNENCRSGNPNLIDTRILLSPYEKREVGKNEVPFAFVQTALPSQSRM